MMHPVISLDLDGNFIFRTLPMEEGFDFCHYVHLTEVRIGLYRYEDFVCFLSQIGKQLQFLFPFSWKCSLLILMVNL